MEYGRSTPHTVYHLIMGLKIVIPSGIKLHAYELFWQLLIPKQMNYDEDDYTKMLKKIDTPLPI